MRFLYLILGCVLAAVCFYTGYKIGLREHAQSGSLPTESTSVATSETPLTDGMAEDQSADPVGTPADAPTPPPTAETLENTQAPPTAEALAARAKQRIITLTDKNDREIVVELLDVRADSLKVRRQVDFFIVEVPVDMLSEDDRIFVDYLIAQRNPNGGAAGSEAAVPDADDMDALFDKLFNDN